MPLLAEAQAVDVLVVGGGIVGVCSAYYCAAAGAKVALLDSGAIGGGCSFGNAGLIVPSHSIPLSAPGMFLKVAGWLFDSSSPFSIRPRLDVDLYRWLRLFASHCNSSAARVGVAVLRDLSRASLALYRDLVVTTNLGCGFEQRGLLMLYATARGRKEGDTQARMLHEFGIGSSELSASEIRERIPSARADLAGATYYPEDSQLVPSEFVGALSRIAGNHGVQSHPGTRVHSFKLSGNKISSVVTAGRTYAPSQVVIAAGSWSPGILEPLGIHIPVQPAKGYSIDLPRRQRFEIGTPLILHESKIAVTPTSSFVRFAGMLDLVGFDMSINRRRVKAVFAGAQRFLAGLEDLETVKPWIGLRPCSPDGLPLVGRTCQIDNLVVATGHGMLGVTLGPITGKLVSEIISGKPPGIDVTLLSPDRFI